VSPRHRLGAALLLDMPAAPEVNGLRRALGDRALDLVAPHLTLVAPVNVRAAELASALEVVRRAAYAQDGPIDLVLGPVATFLPASPVAYLAVSGPGAGSLARLQQAVSAGPLLRPTRWPWVPHITLAEGIGEERASAALAALSSYEIVVSLDRVVLMEEVDRRWHPLADSCFGRPAVIGRGGLELEITQGRLLGPDGLAMASAQAEGGEALALVASERANAASAHAMTGAVGTVVLTARREGLVVGVAAAWPGPRSGDVAHVGVLVEAGARRQGVGRALLSALEPRLAVLGWAPWPVWGHGPAGFFASCSAWAREFRSWPSGPRGHGGAEPGPAPAGSREGPVMWSPWRQ
jgi:2'-5' RNA ligase/GNAT superfamily N-acetyltransferase